MVFNYIYFSNIFNKKYSNLITLIFFVEKENTFKSQRNLKLNPKNNKDFEIDENKKFCGVMTANPDKEIQLSFF